MGTAYFVTKMTGKWKGDVALYRLDPPYVDQDEEYPDPSCDHVIVSAVNGLAYETYLFPATAASAQTDQPESWGELSGSTKGVNDHALVLARLGEGYTISNVSEAR